MLNVPLNSEASIIDCVREAYEKSEALAISAGNSKDFLGNRVAGTPLSLQNHTGIIAYEPTELYITARAGTLLSEVQACLAEKQQMLAFEPPQYADSTTLGGVVASGLAGCRRPFAGSVRDYVLGVRCINGKAEVLNFGGQVIKNVAGYDVSRLLTGSYGTLAVLLEVTLRVAPKPSYETAVSMPLSFAEAMQWLQRWTAESLPISAAAYADQGLKLRLSGKQVTVEAALQQLTGVATQSLDMGYWSDLNHHRLAFFQAREGEIWRLSLPANTPELPLPGDCLIDWAGAQRWLQSSDEAASIRSMAERHGGHASLFYSTNNPLPRFHPLSSGLKTIHQNLKRAFDPRRILNPGRMYQDI